MDRVVRLLALYTHSNRRRAINRREFSSAVAARATASLGSMRGSGAGPAPLNPRNAVDPLIGCALYLFVALRSVAMADTADEAAMAQNPVASVISVPLENNTISLNSGPERAAVNELNIQPVIPFSLSSDWNIITRTILPVLSVPNPVPGESRTNGTGDLLFSAFLSPSHASGWIWGVGTAIQAPTHSNQQLGNNNWGLGPTVVVLHLDKGSSWVYGVLVNDVRSISSRSGSHAYNNGLIQPFVNYNLPQGWYLVSSPIVTVNWTARGSQQWTVPAGGGVGKILHLGRLPVNLQLQGFYYAAAPTYGATWEVRTQVQFLFPK